MHVSGDKYSVVYNPETATLTCSGVLDLRGKESYKDISALFDTAADRSPSPERIFLDVRDLEYLNSSGITTIGGFAIRIRNKGGIRLLIQCAKRHSWQSRSMSSLLRLVPECMELTFE